MSNDGSPHRARVSRRDFLIGTAAASGGIAAAAVISIPAYATNKVPQKAVGYQPTPKGDQRCDNCDLWQPPSSCKLVDGTIAPSGWCTLYKKKK